MADTTDILGLRITSRDGSDAADLGNIIADLGEDVDAKVGSPSLTTTQIDALTGSAKAAGRRVWDSTLGVEKVSNGTTWEPQASRAYVDGWMGPYLTGVLNEHAATVVADSRAYADAAIDAAMDEHAATVVAGRVLTNSAGWVEVTLPTPPGNKRWCVTTGVENRQREDTPTIVKQSMSGATVLFTAQQWTGSWNGMPAEIHYCARLVPANPGATTN